MNRNKGRMALNITYSACDFDTPSIGRSTLFSSQTSVVQDINTRYTPPDLETKAPLDPYPCFFHVPAASVLLRNDEKPCSTLAYSGAPDLSFSKQKPSPVTEGSQRESSKPRGQWRIAHAVDAITSTSHESPGGLRYKPRIEDGGPSAP